MEHPIDKNYMLHYLSSNFARLEYGVDSGSEVCVQLFSKQHTGHPRILHCHDFYELEYVVSGSASVYINGMFYPLSKGTIYLVRPTDMHRYVIGEGEYVRVYSIRFSGACLSPQTYNSISLRGSPPIADLSACSKVVGSLCDIASRAYQKPDSHSSALLRSFTELICSMMLSHADNAPEGQLVGNSIVFAAAAYINENYFKKNITVTSLSEHLRISPGYLGKLFTSCMGVTLLQHLRRVRLLAAANLLARTDLSLQAVALDCGFASYHVFTRDFRRFYGQPPTEFKRQIFGIHDENTKK